ncbi:MAG TPA: hypothetical protein VJZ91_05265 [Blastocatellia bacterium]|nr:hypothetical protein [Blastocatellia bacterium]
MKFKESTIAVLVATVLTCSVSTPGTHLPPAGITAQGSAPTPQASDPNITDTRVIGQVVAIDLNASRIVVKTDAGQEVTILLNEQTAYLRVPPSEVSLDKAVKITRDDIGPGDKVYARGKVSADRKSVPAQKMVVMLKSDIEKDQERQRNEWQQRGVSGVITALNAKTGEITLQVRGRDGLQTMTVATTAAAKFRRYAPDSVRFSDALPSSFADLKPGDQLCALGEKQAEGTRLAAEQVVFGSFRTVTGTVSAIDTDTGEIHISTLGKNQSITILVNKDSRLQRITPQAARLIAQAAQQSLRTDKHEGAAATQATRVSSPAAAGNLQSGLGALPSLTLADIKPGDTLAVIGTVGAVPSRLTAITLLNGVDAVLSAMQGSEASRRAPGMDWGMPQGLLDSAIVRP